MIRIFKQFNKKNTLFFCLAILFSSMECVISSFQPYLLSIITENFQSITTAKNNLQIQTITNNSLELLGIIIGSVLLGFVFRLIARIFHIKTAMDIIQRLRNNLFYNLQ